MEKSAPTEGQTLAWVGICFVRQAYHLTTGHRLSPDKVVASAKKEGSVSIVRWLDRSLAAEAKLGTALAAASTYFAELKKRCRKRKFSVESVLALCRARAGLASQACVTARRWRAFCPHRGTRGSPERGTAPFGSGHHPRLARTADCSRHCAARNHPGRKRVLRAPSPAVGAALP